MRSLGFLLLICPLAVLAQPADNDPRTLQALLNEVQQLRQAIERSTLLGTRTQLAISQLQLQEGKAERLSKELHDVRESKAQLEVHKARLAEETKSLESKRTLPEHSTPHAQLELERTVKHLKIELEVAAGTELRHAAREGELASQAQATQREVQDSRAWIAEMQRSLDTAIQQILKPR